MDSQAIAKLTKESVSRLTSEEYLAAHNDPTTGKAFASKVNELENAPRVATTATRPHGNVRGEQEPAQPSAGFDPSFDELPGTEAPAAAALEPAQPVAAQPAAELPEKIHEYQPLSRDGKKVGGLQRFKYRTDAELIEKLTAAHMASSARIRELTRDAKLNSIVAAGAAPRIQPEKEVPTTVEGLAAELKAQRESNFALSVRAAVNEFQASVGWTKYRSLENAQSVVLAVEKAGDDPTDPQSYHRAFGNMAQFLEPVVAETPVVAAVPAPTPAPAPVAAAATPAVRTHAVGIASGLSSLDGGEDSIPTEPLRATVQGVRLTVDGKTQVMDFRSWDRLPSDTQKRILRSSANAAAIEALYDAENQRRAAARR